MAVDRNRKVIWANTGRSVSLDFMTVVDVIKEMNSVIDTYGDKVEIREEQGRYSDYTSLYYYIEREETDEEMNKRINEEEYYTKMAEDRDAKEFARLKAKFEGKE